MLKRIAVATLLAVGLSGSASATTVTYLFSGVVVLGGSSNVPLGTPFTATLAIELATPWSSVPFGVGYLGAVVSASFSIGTGSGATGGRVDVYNDFPSNNVGDQIQFYGGSLAGTFGS